MGWDSPCYTGGPDALGTGARYTGQVDRQGG